MGPSSQVMVFALVLGGGGCFSKPAPPEAIADAPGDTGTDAAGPCTTFGPWGEPVALTSVNVEGEDDFAPALSGDNRRLVFQRDVGGTERAWEAVWNETAGDFDPPTPLQLINFSGGPTLSQDGKSLWFNRYPDPEQSDIHVATRVEVNAPFGASAPRVEPFDTAVNEQDIAFSASMLDAVLHVYDAAAPNNAEIAIASRESTDASFGPWATVPATTYSGYDCCPTLSPDGLQILWEGGSNPYGVWSVTRPSRGAPFEDPEPFTPLAFDGHTNGDPQFSYDGTRLVYASERDADDFDIYMLTRECID